MNSYDSITHYYTKQPSAATILGVGPKLLVWKVYSLSLCSLQVVSALGHTGARWRLWVQVVMATAVHRLELCQPAPSLQQCRVYTILAHYM